MTSTRSVRARGGLDNLVNNFDSADSSREGASSLTSQWDIPVRGVGARKKAKSARKGEKTAHGRVSRSGDLFFRIPRVRIEVEPRIRPDSGEGSVAVEGGENGPLGVNAATVDCTLDLRYVRVLRRVWHVPCLQKPEFTKDTIFILQELWRGCSVAKIPK